jgi:Phage integrase, N-terminal SAM-like domain
MPGERRRPRHEPAPPAPFVPTAGTHHRRRRPHPPPLPRIFEANIRNAHTRRAYARAAEEFLAWCASAGVPSIATVQPVHVATWIEASTRDLATWSVKQRLAAIRHLFDWLVTGQVVPVNPTGSVRGPRHVVTSGQTLVLDPTEGAGAARQHRCLNPCRAARPRIDRPLGLFVRPHRGGVGHDSRGCLHAEPPAMGATARKGRQAARDALPSQPRGISHSLSRRAELRGDPKGPLFRTIRRGTEKLKRTVLPQANAYAMIGRRAAAAGIATKLGNHRFRATGITAYLKERRDAGEDRGDGEPRVNAHDAAL